MLTQADSKLTTIIAEQEAVFIARQPASARLAAAAAASLAGGVTSDWQITIPQPVWISRGAGSKIHDVDGNEYVDMHGATARRSPGTPGPGGVTALSGVTPDIICLAKSLGGGVAAAAIGGTARVMEHVASGEYEMVGTFNGNPLAMAAARAMLTEVATQAAYDRLARLRDRAEEGLTRVIEAHQLNGRVVTAGAKGCVVFSAEPVTDYRGFLTADDSLSHAHWLFQHNGGVFLPPWGKIEQWLISVQHDEADIARLVGNFAAFAAAVSS